MFISKYFGGKSDFALSSVNKIKLVKTDWSNQLVSYLLACLLLLASIIMCITFACLSVRAIKIEINKTESKFNELFEGQKSNKLSKLHSLVQIIRQLFVISTLMILGNNMIYLNLSLLQGSNLLYLLYVLFVRPMESTKDNISSNFNIEISLSIIESLSSNSVNQKTTILSVLFIFTKFWKKWLKAYDFCSSSKAYYISSKLLKPLYLQVKWDRH